MDFLKEGIIAGVFTDVYDQNGTELNLYINQARCFELLLFRLL